MVDVLQVYLQHVLCPLMAEEAATVVEAAIVLGVDGAGAHRPNQRENGSGMPSHATTSSTTASSGMSRASAARLSDAALPSA